MLHRSARRIINTFHYTLIRTWDMDAREWLSNKQAVPFYGLLPTMEHLTKELLLEAIERMVQFYQEDQALLREELLCFRVMLHRAHRLSEADIELVVRRIDMYDPFLEEDPWVQEKVAEGEARGLAKGENRGELKAARDFVTNLVRRRFPDLAILAEVRVLQLEKPELLTLLFNQLVDAPDEQTARVILETFPNA